MPLLPFGSAPGAAAGCLRCDILQGVVIHVDTATAACHSLIDVAGIVAQSTGDAQEAQVGCQSAD
jgi:hypothetical protein